MTCRKVVGLVHAKIAPVPPNFKPKAKSGTKAEGLSYEKKVCKAVQSTWPEAQAHIWFEFWDKNGKGFCQPDLFLGVGGRILVLEVKRTDCQAARDQLLGLYCPILEHVFGVEVVPVVVAKFLSKITPEDSVISCLSEALDSRWSQPKVLQWLGVGPFPA